jgi:cellulose 1,4-beta-cellobiosidase
MKIKRLLAIACATAFAGVGAATISGTPAQAATEKTPAVVVEPDAVSVPEGRSGTFTVRLSHQPAGMVRIDMRATGTGIWAAPPVILTFDQNTWATPRPFTMYSGNDADAIDNFVIVTLSAVGYAADTVTLTQVDDD